MYSRRPISERFSIADACISNTQTDPVLQEALAAYGYDDTRLQEGADLLAAARDAQRIQKAEYGEQYEATDALYSALSAAKETYAEHVQIARVALRDLRGVGSALMLNGRRKETLSGWMEQATTFYENALESESVLDALARFNVTPDALEAGRDAVREIAGLSQAQDQEKGEAQDATAARDAALDALDAWVSDFRAIARLALADQPQQLEKLRIVAPS